MGIEEIKKAKEEAKKTITRPSQKVAALLIALGPATASEILKNIKDEDLLEQITLDIANLGKISDEDLNDVLNEFKTVFQARNYIAQGGISYAKQLLAQTYGEAEASKLLDKVNSMVNTNPFYFLNEADPSQLANTFASENPQLLALILAYLRPELAAQVLAFLPPDIQAVVSMRIADMTPTNPEILSTIEDIVERKFSALLVQDFSNAGGVESLANILNCCDRGTEKNIMEWLDIENQQMAQEVRDLMFVFEDIIILFKGCLEKSILNSLHLLSRVQKMRLRTRYSRICLRGQGKCLRMIWNISALLEQKRFRKLKQESLIPLEILKQQVKSLLRVQVLRMN